MILSSLFNFSKNIVPRQVHELLAVSGGGSHIKCKRHKNNPQSILYERETYNKQTLNMRNGSSEK